MMKRTTRMMLAAVGAAACALPCRAAENTDWRESGSFAADEAHQAAAADGDFVYAITNDRIARYDRRSGKKLAVSTGEAAHLNSGFVWLGKLYCAHSNYPRTPELSQIKVLDLATMRLTTFHDFGDFGGSLTWVVRRDNAWWCNFARYEEHNAETFLVRISNNWQETGRWTYPHEVIERLGDRSISGGVFDGDELLATDHDNRWLYRLRVPKNNGVLEFIRIEAAPFSGQGIAADPQTGVLVGIDRKQRRVIFAEKHPSD
jgi:hypothetical protein